jgi:MFS family permease
MDNKNRLFYGSCFALITTAFSFSIRAGILAQLGTELKFTAEQLGFINSMWFLGFPLSMLVGGLLYKSVGPKRIMQFAFFSHAVGILLTIFGGSYVGLLVSTFLIGLGNGCTEAACNPMIADAYEGVEMSKKMNRFHMWFPGGIVIGALISFFMTKAALPWQAQIWVILVPTIAYAAAFWGQAFPKSKFVEQSSLAGNLKAMVSPLFLFMCFCMFLTASSEFGPNQWVSLILAKSGAQPMFILALTFGVMAIARYFGGNMVAKFDQSGVLLGAAILATVGLFLISKATGGMAYVSAVVFGLGIAYFWPNMIGFIADKIPKSGALGMSIVGACGMFAMSVLQPVIGRMIDSAKATAAASGLTGDAADLVAGQATLARMALLPVVLIGLFAVLALWVKKMKADKKTETGVKSKEYAHA